MSLKADDYTLVYLRTGSVSHQLSPWASPNSYLPAACGASPQWPDLWRGTGDQRETDRAASLPLCKRCKRQTGVEAVTTMGSYWEADEDDVVVEVADPDPSAADCLESLNVDESEGGGWVWTYYCTRTNGHGGRHLAHGMQAHAVCAAWPGMHVPTEADLVDEVTR